MKIANMFFILVTMVLCGCNDSNKSKDVGTNARTNNSSATFHAQAPAIPTMVDLGNGLYFAQAKGQQFVDMLKTFKNQHTNVVITAIVPNTMTHHVDISPTGMSGADFDYVDGYILNTEHVRIMSPAAQ